MSQKRAYNFFKICVAATVTFPSASFALPNNARVPVLLYHSHQISAPCDYANNASAALASDLETIRNNGFTVVPAYWIAEWVAGIRDGSTLPNKVVGITFDDGHNQDWIDNSIPNSPCSPIKSFRTVLQEFKSRHPELPYYSPHAATFVIASPAARNLIGGTALSDDWWNAANASGIIEVYNHSADHDHSSITRGRYDGAVNFYIPAAGYGDYQWQGQNNFYRIDSYREASFEVANSAMYIQQKTGAWPDLFAYPFGHASEYMKSNYFPNHQSEHQTLAAFCTERESIASTYATRASNRYCLGRFSYGYSWTSPSGLQSILSGAP